MAEGHGLMERIGADWKSVASAPRIIEVPEWADPETGEPQQIHIWPASLHELELVRKRAGGDENSLTMLVETLIVRARDGERKPLFQPGHCARLMREADTKVLTRVVREINADLEADPS
mgnify:FL=1